MAPDLELSGGAGNWRANGSAGLDGSLSFDVSAVLPESALPISGSGLADRALSAVKNKDGTTSLSFQVGGTTDAPTFTWNAKKQIVNRVKNEAERVLKDKGQELLEKSAPSASALLDAFKGKPDSTDTDFKKSDREKAKGLLKGLLKKN